MPGSHDLMRVGTLAVVALLTGLPCAVVSAHGAPPTVLDVLAVDQNGPRVLRFNAGIAWRQAGGEFVFLCPALWGDEHAGPALMLADQQLLIASSEGLRLLDAAGQLQPHPAANAQGFFTELVRTTAGIFGLRVAAGTSELVWVDAQQARTLWSAPESWFSLAAGAEQLTLQRIVGEQLEQVVISSDGVELERASATLVSASDYVFARADGGTSYALLVTQGRPELGSLVSGGWRSLLSAQSSISGPVTVGEERLVTVDGQLQRLTAEGSAALPGSKYLTCIEEQAGQLFACARHELIRVSGEGQGAPLFSLAQLTAPALTGSEPRATRERCDYQWQDLRFDLLALGVAVEQPQPPDSGVAAEANDANVADAAPALNPESKHHNGCAMLSLRASNSGSRTPSLLAGLGLVGVLALRRKVRSPTRR